MKLNLSSHQLLTLPSRFATFKHVGLLSLIVAAACGALLIWLITHFSMHSHYFSQANNIGKGLASQYQFMLKAPLVSNDIKRLNALLAAAVQDQNVASLSVYDELGQLKAQKPDYLDYLHLHQQPISALSPIVFVNEITQNENGQAKPIGYVRLVMDAKFAQHNVSQAERHFLTRSGVLFVLAGLLGVAVTRRFYQWRIKSLKIKTQKKL